MPRKQRPCDAPEREHGNSLRFIPVIENELDARERRERIQLCLVQMFLRASTPGKRTEPEELLDLVA